MTDFQGQSSAAAFWRQIDQRINRAIKDVLNTPSGITPDTAFSSVTFDKFGRGVAGGAGENTYTLVAIDGSNQSFNSGSADLINWDTAVANPASWYSAGTPGRLTVTVTGLYLASMYVTWANNSTGTRKIVFRVNNTANYAQQRIGAFTGAGYMGITTILSMAANDYIEGYGEQTSGGALNMLGGQDASGYYQSSLAFARIG
jgi:hypothetical protein